MLKKIFTLLLIIISLSIAFSYGSPRMLSSIAGERGDNLNYQLTENVFPEHYTLKITPHFNNKTFIGYAKVLIHVKKPTDNITLHQKNLNIRKEKIYLTTMDNLVINIKDARNSGTEEQEFYTITFPKLLTEDKYYLHIPEFHGVLNNHKKGFYYGKYIDTNGKLRLFALTKFEATAARYAFPCFDEPSFRAKFKIYIVRPSRYQSRSNTNLIKSIKLNNNLYEDEFEDTLSMSTYLLEFIISEMKLSAYRDTDFHKILARPKVIAKNYEKSSLNASVKILKTFETYLNLNYSMNKLDHAAIPDDCYASGATEHWGLITYRESVFLLTPETATLGRMSVDKTIVHEIAHQWFGNLVSVKWWRYLWLKEGFARYLENVIVNQIKPEWRRPEEFIVVSKHGTLKVDSTKLTRTMNQDAGTPKEIAALYDIIAYEKSACVIQMLENILTLNVFKRGLTIFLKDRAFKSCVPIDLYRNLQKSLDNSTVKLPRNLNIEKIMTTWDSLRGYPLVYVERNYDKIPEHVKLTQSRCISTEVARSEPATWYIPINYASKSDSNFNDTRFSNWLLKSNEEITISNLKLGDWLIFNKQEAYYYRVNYDIRNWKLIAKALKENYKNIHLLNRAQLIDDSFSLAKMDQLDYSIPLEISSYLDQEDDYITDLAFVRNLKYIANILRGADVEPYFRHYVIRNFKNAYKRLGNNPRVNDTLIDKLHRVHVVSWMCKYNYSQCRANTWKTFYQLRKTNKSLIVDLEAEILCNAMRYGNENDWNYLLIMVEAEGVKKSTFGSHAFAALGCTENVTLLKRYMNIPLISNTTFYFQVIRAMSESGSVGLEVATLYVADHFNILCSKYNDGPFIQNILSDIASYFTTEVQLDNFIKLLSENRTLNSEYLQLLEKARPTILQVQKRVQQIAKFYYSHHEDFSDQIKSDGNLYRAISNVFSFIICTAIAIIIYI